MKLFAKGKGEPAARSKAPAFSPIDRVGLLGLLDQVVNNSQSGVLELREPRGEWVYAFQSGALTHARGGRVRGARQAFDLLWEFQSGEFTFTPGVNPTLAGNLYIDKGRLLDLLRRSQAVLQGPSAPYIPPDQQRPIAPVYRTYSQPVPGQVPPWPQQGPPPGQYPGAPAQGAPQGWPPAPQPGMPQAPSWGAGGYPQQPGYPAAPYQQGAQYPGAQPQGQPYPQQQGYPGQPQPGYPAYPQQGMPQQQQMPQQGMPQQQMPQQPMPQQPMPQQAMSPQGMPLPMMPPVGPPPPAAPAAPTRPLTPQSFSVPPMAIPKKRDAIPSYQPPAAPMPAPAAPEPAKTAPKDDLASLRASLVAQAPAVAPAPSAPTWGVRTGDGTVAPPPAAAGPKRKGKDKTAKTKGDSKLMASINVQLITFLLWACERKYSPDDHWTLKDAFEVSTMELRDQFISTFSESFKASRQKRNAEDDDDTDNMAAGRMRGRGRRH
ncbi:MAG TPA: DUF4388 domain-containing protein [Candidatus Dormibacteraeota bacterium]|nr:DUF4388 domain-containing protein [Candidatus Dormibacteraeota bacterium]